MGRPMQLRARALRGASLALLLAALPGAAGGREPPPASVLFVGNSYTYVNDLPGTFQRLAASAGRTVVVEAVVSGGAKLFQHARSPEALARIAEGRWGYVVLQEQSQNPSLERLRTAEMYPAARTLVAQVRRAGETPIFYMTWGHRGGDRRLGFSDYASMQQAITDGYLGIARELGVAVAPVGAAWRETLAERPALNLWRDDGSHPSPAGTYLAACVLYATLFRQSPEGLAAPAGMPREDAAALQRVAARTVLREPERWTPPQ